MPGYTEWIIIGGCLVASAVSIGFFLKMILKSMTEDIQ